MNRISLEENEGRKKVAYAVQEKDVNLTYPDSQSMFRRLVEKGYSGVFMADTLGYLFYVNHAFVSMLGYDKKDDIVGMNLADVLLTDLGKREEFLNKLNAGRVIRGYELALTRKDGIDVILSATCNVMENSEGTMVGIEGFVHDVTEKSRFEKLLLTEKKKLEQILEFDEIVGSIKGYEELINCVVDKVVKVLEAQRCSIMMLDDQKKFLTVVGAQGISESVIKQARLKLGDPIAGIVAGEDRPILVKNIEYDRKFQRANRPSYFGRSFMIAPVRMGDKAVGVINVADKMLKKGMQKGSRLNYEETFTDIDLRILCAVSREVSVALENIKHFKELHSLAVTDPLVHIYNYRQFTNSLEHEMKRCHRNDCLLCIIMIDVDDFKAYNDTFGHQAGDALLRSLGKIFQDQLREVDIVCRYAGDEFTIILPDTSTEGARHAAEKIQKAVRGFPFNRPVTLSIGIASYHKDLTQHDLISNVDKALYRAKKEGKDRISVY